MFRFSCLARQLVRVSWIACSQRIKASVCAAPGRDAAYTPVDSLGNSVNGALLEVGVEDMGEELLVEICNQNHEVIAMNTLHLSDMWEVRRILIVHLCGPLIFRTLPNELEMQPDSGDTFYVCFESHTAVIPSIAIHDETRMCLFCRLPTHKPALTSPAPHGTRKGSSASCHAKADLRNRLSRLCLVSAGSS